jgi:hypothetical protein
MKKKRAFTLVLSVTGVAVLAVTAVAWYASA